MRMPIKLNGGRYPGCIRRSLRASHDPRALLNPGISETRFTSAVGAIKVNGVFKTTKRGRFPKTVEVLSRTPFASPPVVLDVGASDGSTSLSVMEAIDFSGYYVTDREIEVTAYADGKSLYIYDSGRTPILYANGLLVIYNDSVGALWPLGRIARAVFTKPARLEPIPHTISLINPRLRTSIDSRVRIQRYNALETWDGESVDLIIVANLLNRSYFSDKEMAVIIRNLQAAMKGAGRLAVIDNRREEQSDVFRLENGRFVVEAQIGPGCQARQLILSTAVGGNG